MWKWLDDKTSNFKIFLHFPMLYFNNKYSIVSEFLRHKQKQLINNDFSLMESLGNTTSIDAQFFPHETVMIHQFGLNPQNKVLTTD